MYAQVDKPKGNKSRAVANSIAQKKSKDKQGFGFVDNRTKFATQRLFDSSIQSYSVEYLVTTVRTAIGYKGARKDVRVLINAAQDNDKITYNLEQLKNFVTQKLELDIVGQQEVESQPIKQEDLKEGSIELQIDQISDLSGLKNEKKIEDKPPLAQIEQEAVPDEQIKVQNSPGQHNIVKDKDYFSLRTKLIPKKMTIRNLFRGDSRYKNELLDVGFKPGQQPKGYVEKMKAWLKTRDNNKAERDSSIMIKRESGIDINPQGGKKQPPTDLVNSLVKLEKSGGKKITLLNYVCTGPDTGAGTISYLIKVDETFECISASPTIGLYQSLSGMQIVAVAQSSGKFTGYANFTEYDFLTPIPPERIYFASNDGGKTQVDSGNSWFRLTDNAPR